jgi:hypothetical protein
MHQFEDRQDTSVTLAGAFAASVAAGLDVVAEAGTAAAIARPARTEATAENTLTETQAQASRWAESRIGSREAIFPPKALNFGSEWSTCVRPYAGGPNTRIGSGTPDSWPLFPIFRGRYSGEVADDNGKAARSAAWGVAAALFGGGAIATWPVAVAPKSTFPIWPTYVFGGIAILALYLCFASVWGWWPSGRPAPAVQEVSAQSAPAEAQLASAASAAHADAAAQELAIDINGFLGERQVSARSGTRRYDAETVNEYHKQFASRLVQLGRDLRAIGTPQEGVALLLDRQTSVDDINQVTHYLKYREWLDGSGGS